MPAALYRAPRVNEKTVKRQTRKRTTSLQRSQQAEKDMKSQNKHLTFDWSTGNLKLNIREQLLFCKDFNYIIMV